MPSVSLILVKRESLSLYCCQGGTRKRFGNKETVLLRYFFAVWCLVVVMEMVRITSQFPAIKVMKLPVETGITKYDVHFSRNQR